MASREQLYQTKAEQRREEMAQLLAQLAPGQASAPVTFPPVAMTTPSFTVFNPTSELWKDYWSRCQICMEANSIPILLQKVHCTRAFQVWVPDAT